MLKFVSSFDDLKDFEDRNTYYLRIRIHPNYTGNKTLALDTYLQKLRFFLLDVSRHIQPCVDDDWSWVDYLKREKKIVQYSLMREFDSVLHQIAKGNESNDIQVLLNAIIPAVCPVIGFDSIKMGRVVKVVQAVGNSFDNRP